MKRVTWLCVFGALISGSLAAQSVAISTVDSAAFRRSVDLGTSLADLAGAVSNLDALDELAQRVLVIDGIASSITVFSEDPTDFYVELELVGGTWSGVESVEMHRTVVILDDPIFDGRVAERAPRDPAPRLIVRNDRVLVAGRLISLAEDGSGDLIPVLQAFDIRPIR